LKEALALMTCRCCAIGFLFFFKFDVLYVGKGMIHGRCFYKFMGKMENPQVVSILCTWAFDENQKKEGPVWVGEGRGRSSFAVTKRVGPEGRGKLCHRKRPVDDRMTWYSGSSPRKDEWGPEGGENYVTGNGQLKTG
jgi:hypothetical protein